MPDEPQPQHWLERIFDKLLKFAGPILLAYIATMATRNAVQVGDANDKLGAVEVKQVEAAETSAAVKTTLDTKATVDAEKEKKTNETQARLLYGQYKWLEDNAVTPKDREEAAAAKKLYEEYAAKREHK